METMTAKDWEDVDFESRNDVSAMWDQFGATDIGFSTSNCAWDLSCIVEGKKAFIEVKDRSEPSFMFSDVLINKDKSDALLRWKQKCGFDRIYVVACFKDDVMYVGSLLAPDSYETTYMQNTTTKVKGASTKKRLKKCVIMKPKLKVKKLKRNDGTIVFTSFDSWKKYMLAKCAKKKES